MAAETSAQAGDTSWGRVLLCGGTNWQTNGRKDRPSETSTDLVSPHVLRSLNHRNTTKIIGGPAANCGVAIDEHGDAYLFGKLPTSALGNGKSGIVSEHAPLRLSPRSLGLARGVKWVEAAIARSHVLLVASDGSVWGCGNNVVSQIGLPPRAEIEQWTKVIGPWSKEIGTKVIQVSAGHTFSLFLTNTGQVYAAGSSECGQLGNGKTGERILKGGKVGFDIECPPRLVNGLSGKKVVQIASGNQHSLALDEDGYVYAWGFAGYSRLGLQDQKDRLIPTIVPQFVGKSEFSRAASITCGPTNSVVIDRQGIYHMAGKWKNTGDGSGGQPYTSFKPIIELQGCKARNASCGGVTHLLTAPSDTAGGVMTIGFGQGCLYGELGLGIDDAKSSTKPVEIEPLKGADVFQIAAGNFFTMFLARPNDALSDMPRWPVDVKTPDICVVCKKDTPRDSPLECERCEMPYHLRCLDPPLDGIPEGEWFCPVCVKDAEPAIEDDVDDKEAEGTAQPSAPSRGSVPRSKQGSVVRGKSGTPARSKAGSSTPRPEVVSKRKATNSPALSISKKQRTS